MCRTTQQWEQNDKVQSNLNICDALSLVETASSLRAFAISCGTSLHAQNHGHNGKVIDHQLAEIKSIKLCTYSNDATNDPFFAVMWLLLSQWQHSDLSCSMLFYREQKINKVRSIYLCRQRPLAPLVYGCLLQLKIFLNVFLFHERLTTWARVRLN